MLWRKISKEEGLYYPETKAAHSMDKIGDKVYLFGGWNGRQAINTLECLDLSRWRWSLLSSTGETPKARNNHASCTMNEWLYIHGGHDGESWLDDFFVLNTQTLKWEKIQSENCPKARACHTISRIGRKLYIYGGYDGKESFGDIEIFDIETRIWTSLKNIKTRNIKPEHLRIDNSNSSYISSPSPRNSHSAVVYNKRIYIFGGHYQNTHMNDLIIFDPRLNEFLVPQLHGEEPGGLRGHSATLIFDKIYFFGGYDGKNRKNDVFRLTLDDFNFLKFSMNRDKISPRQKHSGCAIPQFKILFFGGFDGSKWSNSIDELDIAKLEANISHINSVKIIEKDFSRMINSRDYSDLIFLVEGKEIAAHKCILFARCEYFRFMFSDYMEEKNSQVLIIKDWDYETFSLFLEFVYTSSVKIKSTSSICKLYELADLYAFESLKKYCEDFLSLSLNDENVVDAFILGYLCNSSILELISLSYICQNRKNVKCLRNVDKLLHYPNLMIKILLNL